MTQPSQLEQAVERLMQSSLLRQQHADTEALALLDLCLDDYPGFLPALAERGLLLKDKERYLDAIRDFDSSLALQPRNPPLREMRDATCRQALAFYAERLARSSSDAEALFQRGNLYLHNDEFAAALDDYDELLRQRPLHVGAHINRGNALLALRKIEAALRSYETAAQLDPQDALAHYNRGNVLNRLGRHREAGAAFARAQEIQPDLAEAALEQAHCQLLQGNFADGWRGLEARWRTALLRRHRLASLPRAWRGETDLADKTLLLWAEQGFGDTLQFVRFVPPLAEQAQQVILRVPAALYPLLAGFAPGIAVIGETEALPPHDLQCPLMSLPFALDIADFTMQAPYLRADAQCIAAWRQRLGPRTRPRIGIAWAGSQSIPINHTRDIDLDFFLPLGALDVEWISLQKQNRAADLATLKRMPWLRRCEAELTDFAQTAGLIENLDLLICADTAVAHLAGALGKPCWLLLRHASEWRWQTARADSPWYPSLRLFRQTSPDRWEEVVATVVNELQKGIPANPPA